MHRIQRVLSSRGGWWLVGAGCLAVGLGLGSGKRATADKASADDVPPGAVVFMSRADGMCPTGWLPATQAFGRLIVGTTEPTQVGKLVGVPLADQEDRAHQHEITGMVTVPYKSISAANGSNNQGGAAKDYTATGQSDKSPSGLPFVQLIACEKP